MSQVSQIVQSSALELVAGTTAGTFLEWIFSSVPLGNETGAGLRAGAGALAQVILNAVLYAEYFRPDGVAAKVIDNAGSITNGSGITFIYSCYSSQPMLLMRLEMAKINVMQTMGLMPTAAQLNAPPPSDGVPARNSGPDNRTMTGFTNGSYDEQMARLLENPSLFPSEIS